MTVTIPWPVQVQPFPTPSCCFDSAKLHSQSAARRLRSHRNRGPLRPTKGGFAAAAAAAAAAAPTFRSQVAVARRGVTRSQGLRRKGFAVDAAAPQSVDSSDSRGPIPPKSTRPNQGMLGFLLATTFMSSSGAGPASSAPGSSFVTDTLVPLCWKGGGVAAGLVAVLAALLYAKQDSLLYFPEIGGLPRSPRKNPRGYRSPAERGVDAYEDCQIKCDDGVEIHAWLLRYTTPAGPNFSQALRPRSAPPPDSKVPTIIFFHGNAGNIGFRLPNAVKMMQETKSNVLMVEYRGYGDSDSVPPTEAGLKLDAQAALRFCLDHQLIDSDRLFLFGRSLGGAVAFHLAKHAQDAGIPLSGIMVENTFTSIADMVDRLMPAVAWIKSLVLRISWDSTIIVPHLALPILFLAGSSDELVPPSQMSRLVELAASHSESVNLHVIEGGTHNECWIQGGDPYWKSMADFVAEHAGRAHRAREEQGEKEEAARALRSAPVSDSAKESPSQDATTVGAEAEVVEGSAIPVMSNRQFVNFVDLLVGRTEASTGKRDTSSTGESRQQSSKKNI